MNDPISDVSMGKMIISVYAVVMMGATPEEAQRAADRIAIPGMLVQPLSEIKRIIHEEMGLV